MTSSVYMAVMNDSLIYRATSWIVTKPLNLLVYCSHVKLFLNDLNWIHVITFEFACYIWLCSHPSPGWASWPGSASGPTTPERSASVGSRIRRCGAAWRSTPRRGNRRKLGSELLLVCDPLKTSRMNRFVNCLPKMGW